MLKFYCCHLTILLPLTLLLSRNEFTSKEWFYQKYYNYLMLLLNVMILLPENDINDYIKILLAPNVFITI